MSFLYNMNAKVEKAMHNILIARRQRIYKKREKTKVSKGNGVTAQEWKSIKEFYKKYTKVNKVFFDFYTQKTGQFHKNYIPDDIYYCKIDPYFNNWNAAYVLDNKCYYDSWYFKDINMPKTIAKCINGMWSVPQNDEWAFISKEQACELISKQDCFVKQATLSMGGHGVSKIKEGTPTEEISKQLALYGKDIIVQEAVVQSDEMKKLNPHSVNTTRFISLLDKDGSVKVYSTIVRMGINESVVDNASSGGITCGIQPDGRLKPVAYATSGTKYDKHPSTGIAFSDVVIPSYNKIFALVEKLHKRFPYFRLLSWDVAIDKNDEPLLIEVNLYWGELDFHQLNNGPLFGEDTEKILAEVFGKK
jgi:hypothetical protein